jgi:hypothetical protein
MLDHHDRDITILVQRIDRNAWDRMQRYWQPLTRDVRPLFEGYCSSQDLQGKSLNMFLRRTFHECANELSSISERFRGAYLEMFPHLAKNKDSILQETSQKGIEVLKILALSIRSEQDYGIQPHTSMVVGALKEPVTGENISEYKTYYCGQYREYCETKNFNSMNLRTALNKIAHANPVDSTFYASEETHDLILIGSNRERQWIAILSLLDLINVLKKLPDGEIV